MRRDLKTNKVIRVAKFKAVGKEKCIQHCKLFYSDAKIVCVPFQTNEIAVYDIKKDKIEFIGIPNIEGISGSYFLHAYCYQECIFLIPCRSNSILKLDVKTLELQIIYTIEDNDTYIWNKKEPFVYKASLISDNKLYIAALMEPFFVCVDLLTNKVEYFRLPFKIGGTTHMFKVKDSLFFVGKCGEIYKSGKNSVLKKIEVNNEFSLVMECAEAIDNSIYLLGSTSGKIYKINTVDLQVKEKKVISEKKYKYIKEVWHDFIGMNINHNGEIETFSSWTGEKIVIKPDTLEYKKMDNCKNVRKSDLNEMIDEMLQNDCINEGNVFELSDYLHFVTDKSI